MTNSLTKFIYMLDNCKLVKTMRDTLAKPYVIDNVPKFKEREIIRKVLENAHLHGEKNMFKKKFAYKVLLFTGMRVGEATHMLKNWISYEEDRMYINVPRRQKCRCGYCQHLERKKLFYHKNFIVKMSNIKKTRDLKNKEILLEISHKKKWEQNKKMFGWWTPKTDSAIREIPVLPEAEIMIQTFFENSNNVMDLIPSPTSWANTVTRFYEKHLADKLTRIRLFPHALRGAYASTLIRNKKVNMFGLMKVMGWANIQTAQKYIRQFAPPEGAMDLRESDFW